MNFRRVRLAENSELKENVIDDVLVEDKLRICRFLCL